MMRRFLPLLLVALMAFVAVTPAQADEPAPSTGWLQIQDPIRLDDQVHAEHVFMSQGARTAYQWFADGVALAGATRQQLPIGPDLLGTEIHVESVITFDGLDPTTLTSNVSGPDISRPLHISVQAQTLHCTAGQTITPQVDVEREGAALAYQWFLDGEPLPDETSAELTLVESMTMKVASLRVTASHPPYLDAVATSSTNCPILPSKVTPGTVRIVGTPTVGSELYTRVAGWQPAQVQYSHEWFVNGESVQTADVLKLDSTWLGQEVRVRITGFGGAMQPALVDSAPVKVLAGAFIAAPRPTVRGTTTVGWVLSAGLPEWTPQARVSWQWHRVTPTGAHPPRGPQRLHDTRTAHRQ